MSNRFFVRGLTWLAGALWLLASSGALHAYTKPLRTEVGDETANAYLWVGNSFFYSNNSMHSHVESLFQASDAKTPYSAVSVTISGSGIEWHDLASYLRPDGLRKFTINGDNELVFRKPGKLFDAVIMMDCSQCPIHPQLKDEFPAYIKKQIDTVVSNGARPILFMSWAYEDKPEMMAQLAEQYTIAGNANDALVIPAGIAFARAIATRPDIGLYQQDKRHPSMRGTYLAACTVYAATTRMSPVGLAYTAGIDPAIARFLQTIAWETVQVFYAK